MNVLESLRFALERAREQQPGMTEAMSEAALLQILAVLGGEKVTIPKSAAAGRNGRPRVPAAVQRRVLEESMTSAPTSEITERYGISRATLYRLLKRGPG